MSTWAARENAIVAWVRSALADVSGLSVVWAYQSSQPFSTPPPVVVLGMAVDGPEERGHELQGFDVDADAGEEFTATVRRHWRCTLVGEIRAANANVTGNASPHALVTQLLTHLRLESTRKALEAAGVALIDDDVAPTPTAELYKNVWQPIAQFAVSLRVLIEASESTGYFDTARVTTEVNEVSLGTSDIPLEAAP